MPSDPSLKAATPSSEAVQSIVNVAPDIGPDVVARAVKVLDQIEHALDTATDADELRAWLRTMWRTLTGDEQTEPDERGVLRRG